MFTFNPDLARDELFEEGDEAFDTTNLPKDEEDEEGATMVLKRSHAQLVVQALYALHPLSVP